MNFSNKKNLIMNYRDVQWHDNFSTPGMMTATQLYKYIEHIS